MKNFVFVILAGLVTMGTASAMTTKEVAIGVNNVYVPGGFDTSSDVYVVVNVIFPNGCYKWSRADIKHVDTYNHEIRTYADVSQGMCIMVLIPFQQEVRLGKFASGKHTLHFMNGDGTSLQKPLIVE